MGDLPIIDVAPLRHGDDWQRADVARQIDAACRDTGFFYVIGHGVAEDLTARLDRAARRFFALSDHDKAAIAMARGGRAWRGWFPLGGELTSGVPDRKEGLYFGTELGPEHPRVAAGVPLHGANLFPDEPADLRPAVLGYLDALTGLGHLLLQGMAQGLGLGADWFGTHLTTDPTVLFRIFRYPPAPRGVPGPRDGWGVAEHTDYGLLTMVHQDPVGGLEVRGRHGWQEAPPVPGSLVCNLGDMLERMTAGLYRSTPHRVRNRGNTDRLSFAFFFDPSWDAAVAPLPLPAAPGRQADDAAGRWDGASVHDFRGTYGDYLLAKVAKVFPDLGRQVID